MSCKKRKVLILACVAFSILILFVNKFLYSDGLFYAADRIPLLDTSDFFTGFLVDTPACKIPNINPVDKTVRRFFRKSQQLDCSKTRPSITYQEGTMLRINRTIVVLHYDNKLKHCQYQAILRGNSDFLFDYSETRVTFTEDIDMKHEFIRVFCYSTSNGLLYSNFHAFIIPKPDIEAEYKHRFVEHIMDNKPEETLSVLMIGIDSVSRLNFMRQMPKTRTHLIDMMGALEFSGFNKVADNTFVNLVPMLTGKYVEELPWDESKRDEPFDDYNFIWKKFTDAGYLTLYAEDAPKIAIFTFQKEGFHRPPTTYYNRQISIAMEAYSSVWKEHHHCIQDKAECQMVLDYVYDFANYSRNMASFGFSFITRISHDNINSAGQADLIHLNNLKRLQESGILKNTVLIFFSDHGLRFGAIRKTYPGKFEERLPVMFFVFPKWFHKKYPSISRTLHNNKNKLTTQFDIYETLVDLLHFKPDLSNRTTNARGISLFQEIPKSRTCKQASILPHWCTCATQKKLSVTNSVVRKVAKGLLSLMNSRLSIYSNKCAVLKAKHILEASIFVTNDEVLRFTDSVNDVLNRHVTYGERSKAEWHYQLMVQTQPGDGEFEATFTYRESDRSYYLAGDISRLNRYGNQSDCIESAELKKFCYCV